jgi:flagellar hook protein FlgE
MNVAGVSSGLVGSRWAAVSGMRDAAARLDVAANNVANASTEGFRAASVVSSEVPAGGVQFAVTMHVLEGVDVAAELIAAMVAEATFAANARILAQADRMDRRALDLLA